ncbi:hypothetical protein TPB0596_04550 [Tsukamurella pulmonis]|uniref:MucR family transcriptional regulator n=1 Tax=Tsukamurella pulmonis TaxID=47312 RepID=UPI001EE055BC|nr:MucR family transcriptional regulator [Tsukamurella pulmonis]BDD80692.1 hypothetical protein TPB0596_04550 [Tsukamurella pulmonis]
MAQPLRHDEDDRDGRGLVFDGERLQCAECDGWYRHLATHVFLAHGMLAEDYRAEYGLPASVPLVVGEISATLRKGALERGTEHLDVWRTPGTAEHTHAVAKIRETRREQADQYWGERLAEVGWRSWFDATGWAAEAGVGWREIGERLGISWQSARTAGLRAGAPLRHRSWRLFELAEAYVHEHGNLDYPDGELAQYLNQARHYVRNSGRESAVAVALDALDPNWRLTAAERITQAVASGEVFEHPTARRHRLLWDRRLNAAGWDSWADATVWAAQNYGGAAEIADRLGTDGLQVTKALRHHWSSRTTAGEDPHAATAPHIKPPATNSAGALSADNDSGTARIQCMVCGLWMGTLAHHLPVHDLTAADYRTRYRLPDRVRMAPYRPRRTQPASSTVQSWESILHEHGFPNLEAALDWAVEQNMSPAKLANHLGVTYTRLNRSLKAAGLRFPTIGDRMLTEAQHHVAAGGTLSAAPTAEMRAWIGTVRSSVRNGRASQFAAHLDQLDPQWQLTEAERAAADGRTYVRASTRTMQHQLKTGLARARWDSIEQAVQWAHAHNAPASAIAHATGIPTARIRGYLKTSGHTLPTPPRSGNSFHIPLTAITDHLHQHGNLKQLSAPLRHWLTNRQQLETTGKPLPDPWINDLLDHLHPAWRTTPRPPSMRTTTKRTPVSANESQDKTQAAGTAAERPQRTASAADTEVPAAYTIDQHWQDRLARARWTTWNDAINWAAHRHAGISAIAHHLGVPQVDVLEQLQHWWTAHPEILNQSPRPNSRGPLSGYGTRAPCPACRLYFADVAAHYSAAHTR